MRSQSSGPVSALQLNSRNLESNIPGVFETRVKNLETLAYTPLCGWRVRRRCSKVKLADEVLDTCIWGFGWKA